MSILFSALLTLGQVQAVQPQNVPPPPQPGGYVIQQTVPVPGPTYIMPAQPAPVAIPLSSAKGTLSHLPPGKHRILMIHPYTCCPVSVCFCLPCGCYTVECGKGLFAEKLRFDVKGAKDVVVKFHKDGTVTVKD